MGPCVGGGRVADRLALSFAESRSDRGKVRSTRLVSCLFLLLIRLVPGTVAVPLRLDALPQLYLVVRSLVVTFGQCRAFAWRGAYLPVTDGGLEDCSYDTVDDLDRCRR